MSAVLTGSMVDGVSEGEYVILDAAQSDVAAAVAPVAPVASGSHRTPERWQQQRAQHVQARHPERAASVPQPAFAFLHGERCVVSGTFDALSRQDMCNLLVRCGGVVGATISRKTKWFVVGADCGERKLEQARRLEIRTLTEEQLYDMIGAHNDMGELPLPPSPEPEPEPKLESVPAPATSSTSSSRPKFSCGLPPARFQTACFGAISQRPKCVR